MMEEVWLLVFLFVNGQVYASGPYNLETCRTMLQAQKAPAACVHKDNPRKRMEVQRGS